MDLLLWYRYEPEVGDVVVGRVSEVGSDRWLVDIRSHQRGQLQLASIHLPGGEQRRRNATDQLDMRKFYQEGDVICVSQQALFKRCSQDSLKSINTLLLVV